MTNYTKTKFFKITITKKIVFFYILLSILTVIFTSVISFLFFRTFIDKQLMEIDTDKTLIKRKFEEMYEKSSNKFELPDIDNITTKENKNIDPNSPFKHIIKDYPNYNFKIENLEGTLEYSEDSKLVYDNMQAKYFVEVTRQISFEENLPFKNIKVTVKIKFFEIIMKSLFLGSIITLGFLIPFIIIFSRTIINPILKVSKGAREIASGNLGIKVKTGLTDELGELAKSFNFMSKELHKMKRIRDDLLAVISHELRSPLGRIKGYTELLYDLKLRKKEKQEYYDSIFNEIDFLNKMVGEIIEISRLELNKEQLFTEIVDLGFIIDGIKRDVKLLRSVNKDIQYIFDYEKELICNIDVEKIKRVLINIIENSIKAKSTKIFLFVYKDLGTIFIKLVDNGVGIPDDQLELVFEKFYRVDKSRDRKTGGFGLGLAICKGIINEHGGNIYFVKKDVGAELHIELPYYEL